MSGRSGGGPGEPGSALRADLFRWPPIGPSFVLRGLDQEISAFLGGFEGISKKQQEKVGKRWQLQMRVAGCLPGTKKSCHPLVSGGIHVLLKSVWEMPTWVILNI